jgi:hypothetical protein
MNGQASFVCGAVGLGQGMRVRARQQMARQRPDAEPSHASGAMEVEP